MLRLLFSSEAEKRMKWSKRISKPNIAECLSKTTYKKVVRLVINKIIYKFKKSYSPNQPTKRWPDSIIKRHSLNEQTIRKKTYSPKKTYLLTIF